MEEDSCSEGCGFESQHRILDGHFSHLFVVKVVMFVCEVENKQKVAGDGPFDSLKNKLLLQSLLVVFNYVRLFGAPG